MIHHAMISALWFLIPLYAAIAVICIIGAWRNRPRFDQ
jgi:hypothetical protein